MGEGLEGTTSQSPNLRELLPDGAFHQIDEFKLMSSMIIRIINLEYPIFNFISFDKICKMRMINIGIW